MAVRDMQLCEVSALFAQGGGGRFLFAEGGSGVCLFFFVAIFSPNGGFSSRFPSRPQKDGGSLKKPPICGGLGLGCMSREGGAKRPLFWRCPFSLSWKGIDGFQVSFHFSGRSIFRSPAAWRACCLVVSRGGGGKAFGMCWRMGLEAGLETHPQMHAGGNCAS